jgi:hypothetical protein
MTEQKEKEREVPKSNSTRILRPRTKTTAPTAPQATALDDLRMENAAIYATIASLHKETKDHDIAIRTLLEQHISLRRQFVLYVVFSSSVLAVLLYTVHHYLVYYKATKA